MPRDRALLSRPGREDEEVLRGDLKSCWFVRCRMLGGVGTNRDVAGEGKAVPGPLGKTLMESPERNLQRTRRTDTEQGEISAPASLVVLAGTLVLSPGLD